MRILYHHRTLADGAEGIHIQEMVDAFEKLGHQVTMHALVGADVRGVGAPNRWSRLKSALPPALFELAALVYNLVDYVRMRAVIRRVRPDLVYKRHAIYDVGVVLAARRAGLPVLLEANAAYASANNQRFERVHFPALVRACERIAVDQATLVAAVSSPMADHLRALARDPSKVVVVPNGANPERFAPATRPAVEVRDRYHLDGAIVIGWSGILRDWHRVELLIEAVASLPQGHVLIVGDGPDRTRLLERATHLAVLDRVHITGRVPHAEVPEHVAAFDIAVAAHDGTGYASPMKVLEYMAMGVPVVAPRQPNLEDFITDGTNGLLFTPEDPRALSAVLARLIGDPALRTSLGRAARHTIVAERNWNHIAEHVLDLVRARRASAASGA